MAKVDYNAIRERFGPARITVNCPAWDGDVELIRCDADDRLDAAVALSTLELDEERKPKNLRAALTALAPLASKSIVDGDVKPFDSDVGRKELLSLHQMALIELLPKLLELNLLGGTAADPVEEAKKNLNDAENGSLLGSGVEQSA